MICSLEEDIENINVKKIINQEIIRINESMYKSGLINPKEDVAKFTEEQLEERKWIRNFLIAIDNFIVYRKRFDLYTIIAGYPWFLDWGRDSLISFEGLLLITKKYDIAKDVLMTLIKDVKSGLIPNRIFWI